MSAATEYLASAGRLRASHDVVGGIVRALAGGAETSVEGLDRADVDRALQEAGAGTLEHLDGPLARTLEPVRGPVLRMRLERDGDVALVWASPTAACFLTTIQQGLAQLVAVPTPALPAAVCRYLRISPRPRLTPALDVAVAPAELATAIATGRAPAGVPPGRRRDVLEHSLSQVRSHWRATSRWPPSGSAPGVRSVEVVDTDAGMWLVVPDEHMVELWPTTPTTVVLALCELVPRNSELDLGEAEAAGIDRGRPSG